MVVIRRKRRNRLEVRRADARLQANLPVGRAILLVIGAGLLYLARGILPPFVVAGALAYALSPVVDSIEARLRLPRVATVALLYLLTILPLAGLGALLEPTLARETRDLLLRAPDLLTALLTQALGGDQIVFLGEPIEAEILAGHLVSSVRQALGTPAGAAQVAAFVVETTLAVFLTLVLLFYLLVDWHRLGAFALDLIDPLHRPRVRRLARKIHGILGQYLRALLFLVALMATTTWLGLTWLFHLPYALPIAMATGLLELVPIVGPITAGAIATVVALTHGGVSTALGVVLLYFILRQLEDQIAMPLVLGRVVRLHPVATIFAVLAGGVLAGMIGMLLAIPVAAATKVLIDDTLLAQVAHR